MTAIRAPRVVFVNRFFYPDHSATAQMLTDLAFALADAGYAIVVVTGRIGYEADQPGLAPREHCRGVSIFRVWTSRFGRGSLAGRAVDYLSFFISTLFVLLRLVRRGDVIVSKTDPPLISVVSSLVCRLRGASAVNWLQDVFPDVAVELGVLRRTGLRFRLLEWLRDRCLRTARANVVVGKRMAHCIAGRGVGDSQLRVIPNWSDGATIRPLAHAENRLRSELGLGGRFIVAYSGNLGRAHDYTTLLGAAHRLRHDDRIVFLISGGGANYSILQREAVAGNLSNMIFRPYWPRAELGLSLTVADIHVVSLLPALEGLVMPSKLYGIMAAGRPVVHVGSSQGEVAEIVLRQGCGFQVSPGGGVELAELLLRLAGDPELAARMGRAARAAYEQHFDFPRARQAWADLLDELLGAPSRLEAQSHAPRGSA